MRNLFIYAFLFSLPITGTSQSLFSKVVASGGGDFKNSSLQLSYTVGELSIQTYSGQNFVLTQGFQQPAGSGIPLPLHWISFTAKLVNGQGRLEWITGEEFNNDHFEVERSADELHFEKFAEVKAAVNTTAATTYNATDPSPYIGLTYYRIRQVDVDGKSSFSTVASIRRNGETNWQVYPNPVHGRMISAIRLSTPKMLILDLYDIRGRLMSSRQAMCGEGSTLIEWDTHSLAPGIYVLQCRNAGLPPIKVSKE